jgi:preprotein translocase SecF subunit
LSKGKDQIKQALESHAVPGKQDLNNSSSLDHRELSCWRRIRCTWAPARRQPALHGDRAGHCRLSRQDERRRAGLDRRTEGVADPAVVARCQDNFFVSDFGIRNVEIVGPQVGQQLRKQAILATLYSLAGMLIYLGFRFEWIYGVAAVLTVFHDTLITVGAFSLLNWEISLTVIAAILTLIGYSNNDTIVVLTAYGKTSNCCGGTSWRTLSTKVLIKL